MNQPLQQIKSTKTKSHGAKDARIKLQAMPFAVIADGIDRLMRAEYPTA